MDSTTRYLEGLDRLRTVARDLVALGHRPLANELLDAIIDVSLERDSMLEALKIILHAPCDETWPEKYRDNTRAIARAAIAKATGGAA